MKAENGPGRKAGEVERSGAADGDDGGGDDGVVASRAAAVPARVGAEVEERRWSRDGTLAAAET